MTSKLGYIPDQRDDVANNLQVASNGNVIYAFPTGFHLVSTIAAAATVTLTARQMLGGMILHNADAGGTATTTATAAELVAAYNGVTTNSSALLIIRNTGGAGTITISGGTGVTFGDTDTVATGDTGIYLLSFTNTVPGSEAVTMYTIASALTH